MSPLTARVAALLAVAALVSTARSASAAGPGCSSDTFNVSGAPLSVEICAPAARPGVRAPVVATETLMARGGAAVVRRVSLDVVAADETSHTIDDAPLASIGIAGTLHMTIGYRAGIVRLEHALLVPGAIALK